VSEEAVTGAPAPAGEALIRANVAVAAGTLVSRITGLIRFALLVSLVTEVLADSYNTANNLPNVIYELALGGVLTATLVPLFTEHVVHHDDDATSAVATVATLALAALTLLATLAAPLVVRLYTFTTPRGVDAAGFRSVTTFFALLFLPQIFFYGVTALASAMLNARRRFFAAAWAPVVNNVVVIAVLVAVWARVRTTPRDLALAQHDATLRLLLGVGTTAGIVATALVLVPALARAGVHLRWRPDWHDPDIRRVAVISGWTIGAVIANQVALYAMTVLAKPGSGGVTAFQAAFILFQMPVGLLAVSIMTTFGPDLARARVHRDRALFLGRMSLGLRSLAVVTMPASALLVALARPTVGVVLQHGFFTDASAEVTADALAAFAAGLFTLSAFLFLLRGFYAHNDTRTPFVLYVLENGINVVVGFALVGRYGVPGLAWSFTAAYAVAGLCAVRVLGYKVSGFDAAALAGRLAWLALAAVVAGEVAFLASRLVGSDDGAGALARLVVGGIAGVATYLAALWYLRIPELRELVARLRPGRGEPAAR
jgi:putative peptidoglycan lipid II flippase